MNQKFLKRILQVLLFLSLIFPLAVQAQANKTVFVPVDTWSYSGTYTYMGIWNTRPYYKLPSAERYLYYDESVFGNSWMLVDILDTQPNLSGDHIKYVQYPDDVDPGASDWYDFSTTTIVLITITDEASGVAPTVTTGDASLVTTTSGTMNGNIVADGGAATDRGFVYSSSDTSPTLSEVNGTTVIQVTSGTGTGLFSQQIGSLTAGQTYYYQAYGDNTHGTTHGGIKSFTTPTTSQPNKYLSGVTTPAAANGVYVWIGNYYDKPAWKHQSQNYWIYYSFYTPIPPNDTEYHWYIDDELENHHGSNDYLFDHADAASCPSSGWIVDNGYGVGTPAIIDYPNVEFTNGSAYSPGNPTGGTTNNPIGRFLLSGELAGANLTAATITVTGTRSNVSNLKIWGSTDATFNSGSDTQLNSQSDGASVTFSGFSSSITTSGTYYFITADLATTASGTIALTIGSQANLTISGGAIASGFADASLTSGTLTIIPAIEMNVKGNNTSIADGDATPDVADHTDFGNSDIVSGSVVRTFTIENTAAGTLTLTDASPYVVISGHTSDFTLTQTPNSSISGVGSTTFQVTFNPTTTGLRSAAISIANNDGNENPYNFNIQGTGIAAPEMDVSGLGVSIVDGDVTPSVSDDTDFGSLLVASGSAEHTFTITNTGSAALNLTAVSPYVTITGHTGDFTLTQTPSNSIAAGGGTTTFKITFDPTIIGTRSATISIANDDANENPYNFSVTGTGLAPEINVQGNGNSIADGDAVPTTTDDTDFGNQNVTSGTVSKTYTIQNTGTSTLTLGANAVSFSGGQFGDFSVTTQPTTTVAASGSTTFTIQFDPSAGGTRSTTVNITNDDTDENPYNFSIQGNGIYIAPTIQASMVIFSSVEAAKMTIGWTNGNGSSRAVFLYQGSAGSASPVANTTYTADTKFGTGTQIGVTGWYCIYNGAGTSVAVTGLMPGSTYRAMVCEYNGTAGYEAYYTSTAAPGNPSNRTMDGIIINEVDCDQASNDEHEFVELYDGGTGNVSLDGLSLVFFNGGTDQSYYTKDLDGYSTDANGYFVLGNAGVTGVDATFTNGILQNGADAVALYVGDATDFPNTTDVTTTNLVDALVYDTGQGDDVGLLILLSSGGQINEAERGSSENHSNQRIPNGTGGLRNTTAYTQQPPTPDAVNYAYPEITSATYDYNTNQLVVTGNYLVSNAGINNDVDVSTLTFLGEGGGTYTLSSSGDVEISSATQFSVTLSGSDLQNVEYLLNKNLTSSAGGTTYNIAAADNWMTGAPGGNDISDLTGNGITVSNYANPVITSSTYDASTGVLVAAGTNFVINPSANDIDASLFTFTGQGGGTYVLTNTSDVEINSSIQFTLTLSANDKLGVSGLLNKNGTQSSGGTLYNLAAADNWMTGSPAANNIADATTGITVSSVPLPAITSAAYNYSTNVLVVTGTDFVSNGAGMDIDVSMLTIRGEGGSTYTLNSSSDVEITSATEFSVTISGADLPSVEALLNNNGTSSAGGTTYNLAVADNWLTGFDPAENIADLLGNGITVSSYANPTITSATYDASTGVLVVTGTNLVNKSGAGNDIDASLLTITGNGGSAYQLTDTPDAELTSSTSFTLTLGTADKMVVHGLLNRNGTTSASGTAYNLAGADNWNTGAYSTYNIADLTGNGITVSNVQTPTITSATYDSDSGVFAVTGTNMFKKPGAANDIDVSKFTITGEGGNYTISNAIADVELTSSTEFSFTVSGSDKTQVDSRLDLFGTQSSGGTIYNLAAAEDWLAGADPVANIADLAGNGITVVVNPKITSATYNAATGVIVVTGTNIQANAGGADIDAQKFTLTGEGGETYTLTNTPDVERTSPTQFTLTLSITDWNAIALIVNKNGTASTSGTIYNLAAADDWCTNVTTGNTADLTGNVITASNVAAPTISSATYNVSTGVLVVTGSRLVKKSGVLNDIDISKFTITGEGGETYCIVNTADVEITSGTQFTVTFDAVDKNEVNMILNKNGASSTSGTSYNLAAAEDWAVGADAAVNVVDATGNGITVSNVPVPVITSASYHWSNGALTATGTGFTKKAGAANDIDASKLIFRGEGGALHTLVGSPDVEITSGTEFTITLDATDKAEVNLLLNKPGTMSNDNTVYNLAALEDWATGADAAVNVVDATTPITAGNFNNPPTGGNDVVNTNEDTPYDFRVDDFTYNDPDLDEFAGIKIESLETAGTLKYNETDVTVGLECPDVTLLVFTSPANISGSPYATFTFKVKDDRGGLSTTTYTMTINVTSVIDVPTVLVNTGVSVNEGGEIIITDDNLKSTDSDGPAYTLTYVINSGPFHGTLNHYGFTQNQISNGAVKYTHDGSEAAADSFKFVVRDGDGGLSEEQAFVITIIGINDPPTFTGKPNFVMDEDEEYVITRSMLLGYINDPDDPDSLLSITFSSLCENIEVSESGNSFHANCTEDWFGTGEFSFTVNDGKVTIDTTGNITVNPVNDLPVLAGLPASVEFKQTSSATIDLNGTASDVESPDSLLVFSFSSEPDSVNVSFNYETLIATVVSVGRFIGDALLTVKVTDEDGGSAEGIINVTVKSDITGIERLDGIPEDYALFQNYPNPFNPVTKIKFGLPEASKVSLKIYDVLGREIATLINSEQNAGYYEYNWNAIDIASGIYFYVLAAKSQNRDFKQIKKMLLIK